MPPKKKGKGKTGKKTKKDGETEGIEEPLSLEQQNLFLKRQVESLKHRLSKLSCAWSAVENQSILLTKRFWLLDAPWHSNVSESFFECGGECQRAEESLALAPYRLSKWEAENIRFDGRYDAPVQGHESRIAQLYQCPQWQNTEVQGFIECVPPFMND